MNFDAEDPKATRSCWRSCRWPSRSATELLNLESDSAAFASHFRAFRASSRITDAFSCSFIVGVHYAFWVHPGAYRLVWYSFDLRPWPFREPVFLLFCSLEYKRRFNLHLYHVHQLRVALICYSYLVLRQKGFLNLCRPYWVDAIPDLAGQAWLSRPICLIWNFESALRSCLPHVQHACHRPSFRCF